MEESKNEEGKLTDRNNEPLPATGDEELPKPSTDYSNAPKSADTEPTQPHGNTISSVGVEEMQIHFSQEEIEKFKEIYLMFDHNNTGRIETKDLYQIFDSLNRDASELKEVLESLDLVDGSIEFDDFLNILKDVEKRMILQPKYSHPIDDPEQVNASQELPLRGGLLAEPDSKVLDFLRLLEEYRRKCEEEGNYGEAQKAREKYEELKRKETIRQLNNIKACQEHEIQSIEEAQKQQFIEFSQAWDKYMSDYEETAYKSLEKLKEKHMLEMEEFQTKVREDARVKMKLSKQLLEIRQKENALVRLKHYDEAEKVRITADRMEQKERQKMEDDLENLVEKKEVSFRHQQQLALGALLKRIQRDRNEQLKQRQLDSQRLIQRNKNLLNDLLSKQNFETKKTLDYLKMSLGMTKEKSPEKSLGKTQPTAMHANTTLPVRNKAAKGKRMGGKKTTSARK